jgi:hypothetical protein
MLSLPIPMEHHTRRRTILRSTTTMDISLSRVQTGMSLETSSSGEMHISEDFSMAMGYPTRDLSLKMGQVHLTDPIPSMDHLNSTALSG